MRADGRERILAVERILMAAERPLRLREILNELERKFGICAERKAIINDIAAITKWLPVEHVPQGYILKNKLK